MLSIKVFYKPIKFQIALDIFNDKSVAKPMPRMSLELNSRLRARQFALWERRSFLQVGHFWGVGRWLVDVNHVVKINLVL